MLDRLRYCITTRGVRTQLNKSAATVYTPAFVLYGREPMLLLEHAVRRVTNYPVASVLGKVSRMQQTVELVKCAFNKTAAAM